MLSVVAMGSTSGCHGEGSDGLATHPGLLKGDSPRSREWLWQEARGSGLHNVGDGLIARRSSLYRHSEIRRHDGEQFATAFALRGYGPKQNSTRDVSTTPEWEGHRGRPSREGQIRIPR